MHKQTPVAIISAYKATNSFEDNCTNASRMVAALSKHFKDRFQQVTSKYNGKKEEAYIVTLPAGVSGEDWKTLINLAKDFKQEYVLHVDANRFAYYYEVDTDRLISIGMYRNVSEDVASKLDNYTEVNGKYYAA